MLVLLVFEMKSTKNLGTFKKHYQFTNWPKKSHLKEYSKANVFLQSVWLICKFWGLFQGLADEIEALALDFTENCQDLLGTKKSNILPNIYEEIFFKLAHYFFSFCECNPISDIHLKHTDHCFQFFSNKIWSITNITRMPHVLIYRYRYRCADISISSVGNMELQTMLWEFHKIVHT